jgi:hypothetical protein
MRSESCDSDAPLGRDRSLARAPSTCRARTGSQTVKSSLHCRSGSAITTAAYPVRARDRRRQPTGEMSGSSFGGAHPATSPNSDACVSGSERAAISGAFCGFLDTPLLNKPCRSRPLPRDTSDSTRASEPQRRPGARTCEGSWRSRGTTRSPSAGGSSRPRTRHRRSPSCGSSTSQSPRTALERGCSDDNTGISDRCFSPTVSGISKVWNGAVLRAATGFRGASEQDRSPIAAVPVAYDRDGTSTLSIGRVTSLDPQRTSRGLRSPTRQPERHRPTDGAEVSASGSRTRSPVHSVGRPAPRSRLAVDRHGDANSPLALAIPRSSRSSDCAPFRLRTSGRAERPCHGGERQPRDEARCRRPRRPRGGRVTRTGDMTRWVHRVRSPRRGSAQPRECCRD